jgi:RNA polymerase sigma-70 factor (ECF subfamily)
LELVLTAHIGSARDAIDRWFEAQRPKLVRTAYSILRDPDEAEDVVQHTMLAVWERAQRESIRRPEGYLARAVYWNALKRRARRRVDVPLETLPESGAASAVSREDLFDPFEIEMAISELPPTQQTVIRLRFYLGLTFREIGNNLTISTNTAASRTRYALANLRSVLGLPLKRTEQGGAQ